MIRSFTVVKRKSITGREHRLRKGTEKSKHGTGLEYHFPLDTMPVQGTDQDNLNTGGQRREGFKMGNRFGV